MSLERENLLSSLNIPKFGSVVHRSCSYKCSMRVKREADDLLFVALECVVALPCICVPNFGLVIEGSCHDFVTKWIVECHSIDDIGMLIKR